MPIDYNNYPNNWLTEIRPRILARANNKCEMPGCDFRHGEMVWSVRIGNRLIGWFRDTEQAVDPELPERQQNNFRRRMRCKQVRVVLTIAHLDHDETNHQVQDDRLKAACQLCHLRFDKHEKARRRKSRKEQIQLF